MMNKEQTEIIAKARSQIDLKKIIITGICIGVFIFPISAFHLQGQLWNYLLWDISNISDMTLFNWLQLGSGYIVCGIIAFLYLRYLNLTDD